MYLLGSSSTSSARRDMYSPSRFSPCHCLSLTCFRAMSTEKNKELFLQQVEQILDGIKEDRDGVSDSQPIPIGSFPGFGSKDLEGRARTTMEIMEKRKTGLFFRYQHLQCSPPKQLIIAFPST